MGRSLTLDIRKTMFPFFRGKKAKKKAKKAGSGRVRARPGRVRAKRRQRAPEPKVERRPALSSVEQMLGKLRRDLLAEIARNRGEESEVSTVEIGDVYDISSQERERELILTLSDMERGKLKEIDDALARVKDKTYGICEECGEKIPAARLKVLPFTRVCVDCKSRLEREDQMRKVLEEEETHQSLVAPEVEEEEP